MSNRRFQLALNTPVTVAAGAGRLILNVIVVSIIIAVAIIPAQLADGTA